MAYDLDFEKPLAEIDQKISRLRRKAEKLKPEERKQIGAWEAELHEKTVEIYSNLNSWQCVQVARHKDRPYTLDYIKLMCDDFFELRGDRHFGDDRAIQGGLAVIAGRTVMLMGNQKGRDTKERIECSFGMAHPEGFRKAMRLMKQAEKFGIPVVTLIDIAGAAIDLGAEERGQSQAIGENLLVMAQLGVPLVAVIIGEGGSGGALALGMGNRVLMLEYSIYTVAAPEAAASIIWRDTVYAPQTAEAMKVKARDLYQLGLVDELIAEPLGGAHRNHEEAARNLKTAILKHLDALTPLSSEQLARQRFEKFRAVGKFAVDDPVAVRS
ncbi:MAG TPA: acetyl-CoA carboxylase carboxyltransferase subunit alpha [Ktedonobacterales bacterium]|jgi:acetyl-CoA carboxylase carboxyl transferase subunit alpha